MSRVRVLFVCLGNICRSPMAEGVFRQMTEEAGLSAWFDIDSAGTSGWHEGEPAEKRAFAAAKKRGYDLSSCVSRPVHWQDYDHFDYIIAMDRVVEQTLRSGQSEAAQEKVHLFMRFAQGDNAVDVPDPYGGRKKGFEKALDLIEDGSRALLDYLRDRHF